MFFFISVFAQGVSTYFQDLYYCTYVLIVTQHVFTVTNYLLYYSISILATTT